MLSAIADSAADPAVGDAVSRISAVDDDPPIIYAIGGPNGAGKTTFAREFLPAVGIEPFLNADSLAAGLSPLRPEAMAIPAARLLLERWRALGGRADEFCVREHVQRPDVRPDAAQGTGGGVFGAGVLSCGCRVMVHRLCCRVRNRVREGGHHVPREDIQRRYLPSVRNFFELYLPLSDATFLYEAANRPPQMVVRWSGTALQILQPDIYERIHKQAFVRDNL